FYSCDQFGAVIDSGTYNNGGTQLRGVQLSLTTRGFAFQPSANAGFVVHLAQDGTSVMRSHAYGNHVSSLPAFRNFNFGYFPVQIIASANSLDSSAGTANFNERSPGNTHWVLSINERDLNNGNNRALFDQLDKITDIELKFGIRSFSDV